MSEDTAPPLVHLRRGTPSDEELAALVAVVQEEYLRDAEEAVADEPGRRTAWSISQRGLRAPLNRESGWGRFSG